MKKQSSLSNIMQQLQNIYESNMQRQQLFQNKSTNLQQAQNSSISPGNSKDNQNPSLSQKIIKYTNELKSYLLSKIQSCSKSTISENKQFKGNLRSKSSKNVLKAGEVKEKGKKSNKSVKLMKPRSLSSSGQYLVIKDNRHSQNKNEQVFQKDTSLSKVVSNSTHKVDRIIEQQKYSFQQIKDLEKRISNLEVLVKTLFDKNVANTEENEQQNLKVSHKKSIIRFKPLVNFDKKKSLSLNNQQDKPRQLTVNKGQQKVEEKRKSLKITNIQNKRTRNSKQNLKPFFAFKRQNLQLNAGYQPILENKRKNSRNIEFKMGPFVNFDCKDSEQLSCKQ